MDLLELTHLLLEKEAAIAAGGGGTPMSTCCLAVGGNGHLMHRWLLPMPIDAEMHCRSLRLAFV